MRHCDTCNEPFMPREAKVRFCCTSCREEFWNDQRRQAMAALRQQQAEAQHNEEQHA